jgi:pilus assembly protein CpaF
MLRQVDGRVGAITVWHADRGLTNEVAGLRALLQGRTRS